MRFIVQREKIPFDQNALSISEGENTVCLPFKKGVPKQHCQNEQEWVQNHDFKKPQEGTSTVWRSSLPIFWGEIQH